VPTTTWQRSHRWQQTDPRAAAGTPIKITANPGNRSGTRIASKQIRNIAIITPALTAVKTTWIDNCFAQSGTFTPTLKKSSTP
jgi:hypothetical protein